MTKCNKFYSGLSSLVCRALLLVALLSSTLIYAQDPPQYGTPFGGVPDPRDASIYQVNMRCFSSSRNLQGVIDRLDHIRNLGVKIIQLMPIQPVSTHSRAVNSPYSWKDMTTVGTEYGTLATLRSLVDGAHARGMAVIMDWVANQTGWDHPWITQHPDWYVRDANGVIQSLNGWNDVAALNHSVVAMRDAQIAAMRYWIFAANIDGYRFDYANGAPASFWTPVITNLRGIGSHNVIINAEGDGSVLYGAGFDYTFSWNFYNNMKAIRGGSSATLIGSSNTFDYNGAWDPKQVVRWLSNHDIYGSEGSPYNIFGGKNGTLAAFVVTAYMKSVPFIYNGMEVGNTVAMPFPFTSSVINWNQDVSIIPEMTKILAHRNYSNAIRRGTLTDYTNNDVCFFKKVSGNETVFVMSNQRNAGITITLPSGIANTTLYDAFTNAAVGLTGNYYLAPYQWVVLKSGCVSTPIVPYLQINAGAWQNIASASLAAGGSFKIGPQPGTGGTWSWTGPGGFISTAREISRTAVTSAMGGAYVATHTNSCGATSTLTFNITVTGTTCAATAIVPYLQINAGAWQNTASASLAAGGSFKIGPQPGTGGSWRWAGPGGFTSTSREISRTAVTTAMGGNYVATYTNSCGAVSTRTFTITVTGSGRIAVEEEATPISVDIYPNPSNSKQLNITLPELDENETATVTINDINGKKAMETNIRKSVKIDHQLPAGLYFIRVRANGIDVIRKIAIE